MVAQFFSILGVITGCWAAIWVSQWVGVHWNGARPAVVFLVLRVLVVLLAGMSIAALFQWCGETLGKVVKEGPLGWLDRIVGLGVGAAIGAAVVTFAILAGLMLPVPREPADWLAHTRLASPAMGRAAELCDAGGRYIPAGHWLSRRFTAAHKRAEQLRRREDATKRS
jgi:uncharacterized membrane protein required for colicin V production